jgi:hypothetical protein
MFGIWGVNNAWNGEPVSPEVLGRRTQLLSHRGPDDRGSSVDPPPGSVEDLLEGEPARAAPDISAAL